MIRTISNSFRTFRTGIGGGPFAGLNMVDNLPSPNAGGPQWTNGVALIDSIRIQPLPSELWTILAYSVRGLIGLCTQALPFTPIAYQPFGRFGKIKTSLVLGTDFVTPTGNSNIPLVSGPSLLLPTDATLTTDLWNPDLDPLPQQSPINQPFSATVPVEATLQLPQSRPLQQAQQLGIGIWMLPSLLNTDTFANFPQIFLFQMAYSIVYDDGQPTPRGTP